MIGEQIVKVYSLQVTEIFCRSYIGRRTVIKVNSLQVTEVFYKSYGWQESCNKSVQRTGNRIVRQYSA